MRTLDDTIGSRIIALRKSQSLTQQEFSSRIGCGRSTIGKYETGENAPVAPVITAICREFNVSETWLREGKGEMFLQITPDQKLAQAFSRMMSGRDDGAADRLVLMEMIMGLTPEQLATIKALILATAERLKEQQHT